MHYFIAPFRRMHVNDIASKSIGLLSDFSLGIVAFSVFESLDLWGQVRLRFGSIFQNPAHFLSARQEIFVYDEIDQLNQMYLKSLCHDNLLRFFRTDPMVSGSNQPSA